MRLPLALAIAFVFGIIGLVGCGGAASGFLAGNPTITGINPGSVAPGGQITISGLNLNGVDTTVTFSGTPGGYGTATPSSGNTTSVTVSVPGSLSAGTYNVSVTTNDGSGDGVISAASNTVTITVT